VVLVAEASMAGVSAPTGVGAAIFGGAALYEAGKLVKILHHLLEAVGRGEQIVAGLKAAAGKFGFIGGADAFPVLGPPPQLPS